MAIAISLPKALIVAVALAAAGDAFAQRPEPPVEVNVEGLPTHVRARLLAKAQEGRTALIQYLHRSYTVHGLRPEFVIRSSVRRG
ncbi:MAG TPA: hypothetical protein VEC19_01505 [Usitatibacter sp.]|nr:hypothetical protein [Usitatibacter sp.]